MPGTIAPTPAMLRAYRLSRYSSANGIVAYVGVIPTHSWLDRQQSGLVILGACNPGGRRRPDGWNNRMMDSLRQALRQFHFFEAAGSLGRWSEPMLMVSMDPRRACATARRFQQNAIIVVSRRRRTRLVILP